MPNLYTIPKLAKHVGISQKTLRWWYRNGWLEALTYSGTRPYFTVEAFEQAAHAAKMAMEKAMDIRPSSSPRTAYMDKQTYDAIVAKYNSSTPAQTPPKEKHMR